MKAEAVLIEDEIVCVGLSVDQRRQVQEALREGRSVQATIEIERAKLPPGYTWERDAIVCPEIGAVWTIEKWLAGNAVQPCISSRGGASTPVFVIDAFRKEGLI